MPLVLTGLYISTVKGWKSTDYGQPPPFCKFLRADEEVPAVITGAGIAPWRSWGLSDCCIVPASMALEWELCEYTVSPDCRDWLLLVVG